MLPPLPISPLNRQPLSPNRHSLPLSRLVSCATPRWLTAAMISGLARADAALQSQTKANIARMGVLSPFFDSRTAW
jgi:hypothetical protein